MGGQIRSECVTNGDFGLVRYDKNGKVDMSFGTGGKVDTPFSAPALALAAYIEACEQRTSRCR